MPDTDPAPAAPAAPAQPTPPANPPADPKKEQLDRESYASLNQEIGAKNVKKDLRARFGTDDLDAIEQMLKKQPTKTDPDPEVSKKLTETEEENKRLKAENADALYTQKIKDAIMPHSPKEKFINSIVRDFKAEYEIREHKGAEYVFRKGSDNVELVGGQLATLTLFFAEMAKSPDYSGHFAAKTPATPGHITPGAPGAGAAGLTGEIIVTEAQQKDRNFMQAIKDSGQQGKFISSGKVDYDKLAAHLKK